jgi:hypothetical protein
MMNSLATIGRLAVERGDVSILPKIHFAFRLPLKQKL